MADMAQCANYSVIDLFSGCGGFSLGVKNAGLNVVAAIDNDTHAVQTYKKNFPSDISVLKENLWKFNPADLEMKINRKTVDVIIGGPPCQGFSTARQVDGANHGIRLVGDERRQLFRKYFGFVGHFRPKVFVMENVRGIRSAEQGKIFDAILKKADVLGYEVDQNLVSAWKFGVPQKRIRQIFFGVRKDLPSFSMEQWLKSTHASTGEAGYGELKDAVTLWEAIGDLPVLRAGKIAEKYNIPRRKEHRRRYGRRYLDSVLEVAKATSLTAHIARYHSDRDLRDFARLHEGETSARAIARGEEMEFPYKREIFKDRYTRQRRDRLCSTIVAHLSRDGLMFIHPTQTRSLTPREAARIQSFPDWFVFPVPRTCQYRLIGDAVPPLLAQAIGRGIKNYLDWCKKQRRNRSRAAPLLRAVGGA